MEIKSSSVFLQQSHLYVELILALIRLRPRLMLPEHVRQFRRQMDSLRSDNKGGPEDYQFIFRILIILAHHPEPPTMGELSAELDIPFSTATRIVDWLVNGDLVERLPDADDRRVIRVRMADAGWRYYNISVGYIRQHIEMLLQDFSAQDQADLYRLISKLLLAFERESQLPAS
jgi:DNA-binding MarR family transcriptional regulator